MAFGTVLLIEDNAGDARLVREYLAEVPSVAFELVHVTRLDAGLARLGAGGVDLVLLDLSLPDSQALSGLRALREQAAEVPIVVLTGNVDAALAERAVQEGAQDYLLKGQIDSASLARVIRFAIERNRVVAHLRDLDRFKSELISTVSHELRTPLTIVREFVSVVHDGMVGGVTAEQQECLESALRNCDRMAVLIDDLLDLSRIESGRLRLHRQRVDIAELVRQCHLDFVATCRAKSQSLTVHIDGDLGAALADRARVQQIVVNLLGNATKFTPDGGRIELRAGTWNGDLWIEVADNGPGIPKTDLDRIFEAFAQLDRAHGPGARGTGLGLTISRRLARLHGGDLTVESARGQGSRFRVTLPVFREGEEFRAFIEDRMQVSQGTGKNVVLILLRLTPDHPDAATGDALPALRQVQRIAEAAFHHHRDEALLVESASVLAFLLEADVAGARIMLQRLAADLTARGLDPKTVEHRITPLEGEGPTGWQDLVALPFERLGTAPRRSRILVVDDDEVVLNTISEQLKRGRADLEVRTARSGYDACIRFAEFAPDLVVLDVLMPGMDGGEVLASMRNSRNGPGARYLAISGDRVRLDEMLDLGCDDVLEKPFERSALLAKADALLVPQRRVGLNGDENGEDSGRR